MSETNEYVDFVNRELETLLEADEEVQSVGLSEDAIRWLISFFWRPALRFYYTVLTNKRIILIEAKTRLKWFPWPKYVPSLETKSVRSIPLEDVDSILTNVNIAVFLMSKLAGKKGYALQLKRGKGVTVMINKKYKGFPEQKKLKSAFEGGLFDMPALREAR